MTNTGASTIYNDLFRSFGLRENPFHVSPDLRFHFSSPAYETAIAELMFGIEGHRGLLVLTGEAGTGKTTLMRHFLRWLGDRKYSSAYIFHSHLESAELFEFILRDFGVPVESTKKTDLLATLHHWLHGRHADGDTPVVIIDEAQALSLRTLSELTSLLNLENSNGKLVQVVLAGQPELEEKLRRPELRALRQRIMVRCRLPLLTLEETSDYITARMRGAGAADGSAFPADTVQSIYSYARGIPRVVNLLCEHALIGAYADRHTVVTPTNIRRVAADFDMTGEPFAATPFDMPINPRNSIRYEPQKTAIDEVFPMSPAAPIAPPAGTEAQPAVVNQIVNEIVFTPPPAPSFPPFLSTAAAATAAQRAESSPIDAAEANPAANLPVPAHPFEDRPEVHSVDAAFPEPHQPAARPVDHSEPETSREAGWRKQRSESAFRRYWREVAQSFLRDMRAFLRPISARSSSISAKPWAEASSPASANIQQKAEAVRDWLRKPI